MDLVRCAALAVQAHLLAAQGNADECRQLCVDCVRKLNCCNSSRQQIELSRMILGLHDRKHPWSVSERVLWLGSKVGDTVFPPCSLAFEGLLLPLSRPLGTPVPATFVSAGAGVDSSMNSVESVDLTAVHQDLLANCSFVCAWISLAARGQTALLARLLTRQVQSSDPRVDPRAYTVALTFNGCKRLVLVDDKVPRPLPPNDHRHLTMFSSTDPALMWPALVEKAFLTVMDSGYEFAGSNMAVDVYALAAWVPEIRVLEGALPHDFGRLWALCRDGHVSLGVGCAAMSALLARSLGLVPHHDYVVESYDGNNLTLRNPWAGESTGTNIVAISLANTSFLSALYINWEPEYFFRHTTSTSFVTKKTDPGHQWAQRPQFSVRNPTDSAHKIWVLVEQHLPCDPDFAVQWFRTGTGERVLLPHQHILGGESRGAGARTALLKLDVDPRSAHTLVVHGPPLARFTATAYHSISDFKLDRPPPPLPELKPITGRWAGENDGGDWSVSTFVKNPQFEIEVTTAASILFVLHAATTKEVSFHVAPSAHRGARWRAFDRSKVLFDDNYTAGSHFHRVDLDPGVYNLIISSYSKQDSDFTLSVYASNGVNISRLSTSLGLFARTQCLAWNESNRILVPFSTDSYDAAFSFRVSYAATSDQKPVTVSDYRPAARVSIFNNDTQEPIEVNQDWNDSIYGVFVERTISQAGNYVLLIERFEAGSGYAVVEAGCSRNFSMK